jgi:hypothetical protein
MSDLISVVDWISPEESTDKECTFGTLGGWFGENDTWQSYLEALEPEYRQYAIAVKDSVIERNHFITGEQHQYNDNGVPLFSDGTIGSFSFRGWGDLMAAIANCADGKPHQYMEYYM